MNSIFRLINIANIARVFRNIFKVGPITTLRYIISDLLFDRRYQIDTINTERLDNLDIASVNKASGTYYEGVNAYVFQKIFSGLQVDVTQSCFVDYGSGKGKAMCLAAELGFKKVIGIEFSLDLVETCKKNLEIFKLKSASKSEFETIHMDATEYALTSDANVLSFFNPFNEAVTDQVIEKIMESYTQTPRTIWVVHLYPQGNQAFIKHPRFELVRESNEGLVFRLAP
jgi:16S rRNA G966 N2-methylase RsmD